MNTDPARNFSILYLDVDGVFLVPVGTLGTHGFDLAPHALEFLCWATAHFDCRWLSSHSRDGDIAGINRAFRRATGASTPSADWQIISAIRVAPWKTEKTDGIDLAEDFYWLDDNPSSAAQKVLTQHGRADRLIVVSPEDEPDALLRARSILELKLRLGGAAP